MLINGQYLITLADIVSSVNNTIFSSVPLIKLCKTSICNYWVLRKKSTKKINNMSHHWWVIKNGKKCRSSFLKIYFYCLTILKPRHDTLLVPKMKSRRGTLKFSITKNAKPAWHKYIINKLKLLNANQWKEA